jgi:phospholipase C
MENHSESSLSAGPYMSSLAQQCGTASDWQDAGSAYDSEPNYIAATTGLAGSALSSFNCDCPQSSSNQTTADNIFRQVRTAGLTEKSYEESMTTNCSDTDSGDYAVRHNPAVFMTGGSDRAACQADDIPMGSNVAGALVDDIAANTLPNFAFVTPNLCNDMHDCSVAAGDAFLEVLVPQILDSASYQSGNTLLIINTDEDTPVLNIVVAPSVNPGTVVTTAVSHYGELRATEEALGLPLLGQAANAAAEDLRAAFNI